MEKIKHYQRKNNKTELTKGIYTRITERQSKFLKKNNIDIQAIIRDIIEDIIKNKL